MKWRVILASVFAILAAFAPPATAQFAIFEVKSSGGGGPNTVALSNTSIVEMSANGTFLGSASIVGSFTGTPAWSLTDALGVFQINSSTGVVTVLNNTNLVNATHPTIPITISAAGTTPSTTPGNFNVSVTVAGGPGLVVGTYGSTASNGWTTIGPSNGTLACACFTNIIYVSDSLGDDNRDGSVPTFVDDNNTVQFVLSSAITPAVNDVYQATGGTQFTVSTVSGVGSYTFLQTMNRTGTPPSTGTLTRISGSGPIGPLTYTARTLGIHGPVKTLIKGAGGSGPGPYDPNASGSNNGDGTGLGSIGNWHTAGAGNGFALRNGKPDWLLLRMGDTFTNQAIEAAYNGGTDNFIKGGFSEQEPLVVSSYDEAVPATSPDLPSGARARPIVLVPGATDAYAIMQGDLHGFQGRAGISLAGTGNLGYTAIMGIDFYSSQRDPTAGAYVGSTNVSSATSGIFFTSGMIGILIEDVRVRWAKSGIANSGAPPYMSDVNIRRNQVDHCYTMPGQGFSLGIVMDNISAIGGPISPGFTMDENVIDLCGFVGAALTAGDDHSRNVYIQGTSVFGSRRGNTSTRSASEDFQFRSGGVIDNNFMYAGSSSVEVGHPEGNPTLGSNTVVTNNVLLTTDSPFGVGRGSGFNFDNSNNVTASNNVIAHYDPTVGSFGWFATTDAYNGTTQDLTITNAGSGGTAGVYGCIGGTGNFTTGGLGTTVSTYTMTIGGGSITALDFIEPRSGTYEVGDVLTPVSGYPSINTAGTTLSNVGTGGTPGSYGFTVAAPFCAYHPVTQGFGAGSGVALSNFSGSMAGSGAIATFAYSPFSSITRTLNGVTGFYEATGTLSTGLLVIDTDKFTVTGNTPSAYNGEWTIKSGGTPDGSTPTTSIVWSLNTAMDPGPVTVPGTLTDYVITGTGKNYVAGDVLTASPGGLTGLRITVGSVADLSGWQLTVATVTSAGVHNLSFTGNTIFNWPPDTIPPSPLVDQGGINDSPGGIPGSGAANIWTGNTSCPTAQFPGSIVGTVLSSGTVVQGTIAIGQNLAGPGVTANTTITGGSGSSWAVFPSQTVPVPVTMYSYTCTPTTVFPHPENTVETYAASLGLTATFDGYMNAASANAKWNWNPVYTANNGINPYIRHGFGMTP
jgi:hypothetical protein